MPHRPRGFFMQVHGPPWMHTGEGQTMTGQATGTVTGQLDDQPEQMTGAQSLVRALERAGVEVIFGIPGGAILPAYDPLFDSEKIRHILVRHEQGAGHAAQGYAMVTGKVGVCMATSGPGATNLVTPIADAHMDSRSEERRVGKECRAG